MAITDRLMPDDNAGSPPPFIMDELTKKAEAAAALAAAPKPKTGYDWTEGQAELDRLAAEARTAAAAAYAAAAESRTAAEKAAADKLKAEADAKAKAEADAAAALAAAGKKPTGVTSVTSTIKAEQDASNAAAVAAKSNINVAGNVPLPATGTITADQSALEYQKAQDALNKAQARQSAIDTLTARFNQYGLGSLAERIKALAVDGATEATITLSLQESPEYQARFKANAVRLKNNLSVLTPAEYLNLEDGYRQVLSTYGLTQFSNDEYVSQFIANDMSATELNSRVTTAVQRIQNADPAVTSTLRDFYGITNADLVGYVLDPKQNIDVIQKKVTAAEIGTAARAQGLNMGTSAEQLAGYQASAAGLAAQGVTQAQAQKGYSAIADILPTAEKLSAIYGDTTGGGYGQTQAEQEMFGQLASAQRARQKLTAAEIANFSGSSGTSKGAFSTGYLNKQSTAGQF